jgi:hypothetical protein
MAYCLASVIGIELYKPLLFPGFLKLMD